MSSIKVSMKLPTVLVENVKDKAQREFGFSIPQLTRHLFAKYMEDINNEEYIHPQVVKEILEADRNYEEAIKKGEVFEALSIDEHINQLTEEIKDE